MPIRVYLAGPDVFLPDPHAWAAQRREICARHGLVGVSPLDDLPQQPPAWTALPEWRRIALRNEAHIARCDAVVANLTPFRGPSADAGTVFEIGFARALGRPVFAYSNSPAPFARRTQDYAAAHGGLVGSAGGVLRDGDALLVEQFGLADNLMIEAAIHGSGGALLLAHAEPAERWRDLTVFRRCIALAADRLGAARR